jgi:cyclin-C
MCLVVDVRARSTLSRSSFVEYDPWLLVPTSMLLAGKVEENSLHQGQGKILIQGMKSIDCEYRYQVDDLVLCELQLLHHIDYQLIVFHPHRQLLQYIDESGMNECLQVACSLANDSYQTDLCMRFPPFLIALGCICLAGIISNKEARLRTWFASLNVEMKYVCSTMINDNNDNNGELSVIELCLVGWVVDVPMVGWLVGWLVGCRLERSPKK